MFAVGRAVTVRYPLGKCWNIVGRRQRTRRQSCKRLTFERERKGSGRIVGWPL